MVEAEPTNGHAMEVFQMDRMTLSDQLFVRSKYDEKLQNKRKLETMTSSFFSIVLILII